MPWMLVVNSPNPQSVVDFFQDKYLAASPFFACFSRVFQPYQAQTCGPTPQIWTTTQMACSPLDGTQTTRACLEESARSQEEQNPIKKQLGYLLNLGFFSSENTKLHQLQAAGLLHCLALTGWSAWILDSDAGRGVGSIAMIPHMKYEIWA